MTMWKVLMTLFKRPTERTLLSEREMEKNIVREELEDARKRLKYLKAEGTHRARLEGN